VKKPYKVYITLEKMLIIEVEAHNEDEAESLALSGYGKTVKDIIIHKTIDDITEVDHDRF